MELKNKQHELFCHEYVIDYNATKAAIRAGYSKKTAYSQGYRLLKKVDIKNRISELMEQIKSEKIASAEEVVELLTSIARGEMIEEVVVVESIGDYMSEAKIIKKQVTPKDRLKALELLGKRHNIFTENLNVTKVPMIVDDIDDKIE